MLPANDSGASKSDAKSVRDPAVRSIMTTAAAALVGTAVGGLSVLGVVMAVVQPPQKEIHAAAMKDTSDGGTGAPAAVAGAAAPATQANPVAATSVTASAQTPPSPPPAPPAAPTEAASSTPPQPATPAPAPAATATPPQFTAATSTQAAPTVPQPTTWPDALSARTRAQERVTGSEQSGTPLPAPAASPEPAQNTAARSEMRPEQTVHDSKARRIEESRTDPANEHIRDRSTAPRVTSVKHSAAKTDVAKRHLVTAAPPPQPAAAPSAEPAATPVAVGEAPRGQERPLFDFFGLLGGRQAHDEGNAREQGDVRDQDGGVVAPPPSAPVPAGRDARVNAGNPRVVRQQRQRRVIVDQVAAPPPPDSDDGPGRSGGGLFGGDNSHRDDWRDDGGHRDWNDNRDGGW